VRDFSTKPNIHSRSLSLLPIGANRSASFAPRILSAALACLECKQGRNQATANQEKTHHSIPIALSLSGSSRQLSHSRKQIQ